MWVEYQLSSNGVTKNAAIGKAIPIFLVYAFFSGLVIGTGYAFVAYAMFGNVYWDQVIVVGLAFGSLIGIREANHLYGTLVKQTRCPKCGKPFASSILGRDLLDRWNTQDEVQEPETTQTTTEIYDDLRQRVGTSQGSSTTWRTRTVNVTNESYLERLKCRFCGFEWKTTAIYRS